MVYKGLPPVGSLVLPELSWQASPNFSPRLAGTRIEDVWAHRWGDVRAVCSGVCAYFEQVSSQVSAHIVYAGEAGSERGKCVQMVRLADRAWTEAAFNNEGVSVEMADAIWLGHDPKGFARAARIFGWLLLHESLPAAWVRDPHTHQHGVTRHADAGSDGGGHYACPTTDKELWLQFVFRVKQELAHGGYRAEWAR